jgi:flagellar assembly protein FliH
LKAIEERRRAQSGEAMVRFGEERKRYFEAVEREVVELSLGIAARILRREAQLDPLLLTGAVRVALGQLAGSTTVRLRVPAEDQTLWAEAIEHLPNLAVKPEVIGDCSLELGECRIETQLGSVDLGLRAQLGEIERGFFDRAGRRRGEIVEGKLDSASARRGA